MSEGSRASGERDEAQRADDAARFEALLREERIARDRAIAEAVAAALEKERTEREEALAAQEHRATHATVNLVAAMVRRQWQKVPARAGAFVFAALMRPGAAAAVGLVALATLALTAVQVVLLSRQNELLDAQNARVDIQTAVAEAGRRADLAREARQVVAEMIAERERTMAAAARAEGAAGAGEARDRWGHLECIPAADAAVIPELCFRAARRWPATTRVEREAGSTDAAPRFLAAPAPQPMPQRCLPGRRTGWPEQRGCPLPDPPSLRLGARGIDPLPPDDDMRAYEGIPPVWYPSAGLALRLASLTKGLPPHRPVVVEEGQDACPARSTARLLLEDLLEAPALRHADTDASPSPAWNAALAAALASREAAAAAPAGSPWPIITRLAAVIAPQPAGITELAPPRVQFACDATSPERGEILLALLDAGLHPDAVAGRGGEFAGALLDRVRLRNRLLEGFDLTAARFGTEAPVDDQGRRYGSLRSVLFHHVTLSRADLRGVALERDVFALTPGDWQDVLFGPASFGSFEEPIVADVLASPELGSRSLRFVVRGAIEMHEPLAGICADLLAEPKPGEDRPRLRHDWFQGLQVLVLRSIGGPRRARVELIVENQAHGALLPPSASLASVEHAGQRVVVDRLRVTDCLVPGQLPAAFRTPIPGASPHRP